MAKRKPRLTGAVRERGNSRSLVVRYQGTQYSQVVHVRTKREAQAMLPAFIASVIDGTFGRKREAVRTLANAPTFREAVNDFLANHMPIGPDGEATRDAYRYGLGVVAQELGSRKASGIGRPELHSLLRGLRGGSKPLAIATIRGIYVRCNRLFKYLVEEGVIATNPMPAFKRLDLGHDQAPEDVARQSVLSPDQISALMSACGHDHALRLWIKIMFATGARAGEAAGIRWGDVREGIWRISGGVKPVKGGARGVGRLGMTKTRTVRYRQIGANLATALAAERERQEAILRELQGLPENVQTMQPIIAPEDYVFPADISEGRDMPCSRDALLKRFNRAAQRAGLSGVSSKWGRHTNVSRGIAGDGVTPGISMVEAAALAGHANPLVTATVYAHADRGNLSRGVILGDDLIGETERKQGRNAKGTRRVADE